MSTAFLSFIPAIAILPGEDKTIEPQSRFDVAS
jgi:hypothetical protein